MRRYRPVLLAFVLLCNVASARGETHTVRVNADGSFLPQRIEIQEGDTVEWVLHDRTDAIVRATPIEGAFHPGAYDDRDPNEFTGPMPYVPSGIFVLGPVTHRGGDEVNAATWKSKSITGVFIRPMWNEIHLGPERFDFTVLDREIDRAVAGGKLYSLAFKAGKHGTPDWIFATDPDGSPRAPGGGVRRLTFQDGGSQWSKRGGRRSAGTGKARYPKMDLGNPCESAYQKHYFAMLEKVAEHLRMRVDRYRALAYIKPSGANLFTHENRLPKRAEPGTICNPGVWAENGYTPSGLVAFYGKQSRLLADQFPGKAISYMLIQAGFPLVNDAGDHLLPTGGSSGGPLPRGTEQTERILVQGSRDHGKRFLVQHNGLGPSEKPNRWVLRAGVRGQPTGWQTTNQVLSPRQLEATFQNAWSNSRAIFVEIYEKTLHSAERAPGGILDPKGTGRTIADWANAFHERRRSAKGAPDPFPTVHRHTFRRTAQGRQDLYYVHGSKRGTAEKPNYGIVTILP